MPQRTNLVALSEIAEIRSGFTFREKVEEVSAEEGNAHVAQIKDVRAVYESTNSSVLKASQLPCINWEGKDKAFAETEVVLLPARGARGGYFRASILSDDPDAQYPVVVSSQFLIIKPNNNVLPAFLCWALNQNSIQHALSDGAASQGTSIVMLSAKIASELKLEIPSIDIQQKILHLNELWEHEQRLTHALLKNRELMMQGMFNQLLKDAN
ncbi:restriction endonuclease subunit S [Shewanella xiamenensis]|uniref:restriction endonuclease subunit S n=1 Tax=Shewanella xiamenensis TaxID=332186 RepID=UPI0035BA49B6